jgi:hypothetical protein
MKATVPCLMGLSVLIVLRHRLAPSIPREFREQPDRFVAFHLRARNGAKLE